MISVHPERTWVKPTPPAPVRVIDGVLVKRYAPQGTPYRTFASKGGMMGGRAGACKAVTGGKGLGGSRWA